MKRQNRQFTKFISLLKFPGLQYFYNALFSPSMWNLRFFFFLTPAFFRWRSVLSKMFYFYFAILLLDLLWPTTDLWYHLMETECWWNAISDLREPTLPQLITSATFFIFFFWFLFLCTSLAFHLVLQEQTDSNCSQKKNELPLTLTYPFRVRFVLLCQLFLYRLLLLRG